MHKKKFDINIQNVDINLFVNEKKKFNTYILFVKMVNILKI